MWSIGVSTTVGGAATGSMSSQAAAWRQAIEVSDTAAGEPRTLALFPGDRGAAVADDAAVVRLCLSALTLRRPWQGARAGSRVSCGLICSSIGLGRAAAASRKGMRWGRIPRGLAAYRLIASGSEWKLHRDWFGNSAMADLVGADLA